MEHASIDLAAYADRIRHDGAFEPTLAALGRIVAGHAAAIPFENIDVLAGRVPGLDPASLQAKLVQRARGGYCFEQNGLLLAVLRAIGFDAHGREARVRAGVPADVVTARTHMAIEVRIDAEAWMVDCGFGSNAPLAPLRLASREEQAAGTGFYRFVDQEDGLLLQARSHAGYTDCYRLMPSRPHAIDYEIGNWFVATHPKAMLRNNLLVGRAIEGGRMRLFNRQLLVLRPETGVPEERRLSTPAEVRDVLADGFGLALESREFEAVIAVLERADEKTP